MEMTAPVYRFAILGLITTGERAVCDRITEIALAVVEQSKIVEVWSESLDPEVSIYPSMQAFSGVGSDSIAGRPIFGDIVGIVQP